MAKFLICLFTMILAPSSLWAWGEPGHDLITRVGVRLLKDKGSTELYGVFLPKENMLGHFANVPDIVWREGDKAIKDANAATHYIDMEYLLSDPKSFNPKLFPETIAEVTQAIKARCGNPPVQKKIENCPPGETAKEQIEKVGTAPWRVKQLADLMAKDLGKVQLLQGQKKPSPDELIKLVNDSLLHAGVMSHFIGDLAQPMHVTEDYDGWDRNQGGIHRYFETDLVASASLGLDEKVYQYAKENKPFERRILPILKEYKMDDHDAFSLALALVYDSYVNGKERLYKLDKEFSLVKPSSNKGGLKVYAERKKAEEVYPQYESLIVERLAVGADVLSHIWNLSWEKAGKPKLDFFQSYDYPVKPEFIWPEYMGQPQP